MKVLVKPGETRELSPVGTEALGLEKRAVLLLI